MPLNHDLDQRKTKMKPALFILCALLLLPHFAQAQNRPPQPVFTSLVQTQPFTDTIEALGTLRANETVTLTATVTEQVQSVNFEDGQRVKKGDILIEMRGAQQKAELAAEQATLAEAKRQLDRIRPLVASGAASQSALDTRLREYQTANARLDAIRARLGDRIITAPFDGVLGLRNISIGTVLQPGTTITTLDDDSIMKLDFSVPAHFLPALETGLEITATAQGYENQKFTGTITSIASQIDPITRAVIVRATLPNPDLILKPGLLMRVNISSNPRQAILIPEEAILSQARNNFVFTTDGHTATRKQVTLGTRRPGLVEITQGLDAGDTIITHGHMNLTSGAAINLKQPDDVFTEQPTPTSNQGQ